MQFLCRGTQGSLKRLDGVNEFVDNICFDTRAASREDASSSLLVLYSIKVSSIARDEDSPSITEKFIFRPSPGF